MLSDLFTIFVMTLIALLITVFNEGAGGIRRLTEPILMKLGSIGALCRDSGTLLREPHYRVMLIGLIMLIIGWGKITAFYGFNDIMTTISDTSSAKVSKARECLDRQRATYAKLLEEAEMQGRAPAPGLLQRAEKDMECPFAGQFLIDRDGYLTCSRHGRNGDLPPLPVKEARK